MKLEDFKLIKNRARPQHAYTYRLHVGDNKYEIYTMNGGLTYYASLEILDRTGSYRSGYNETFPNIYQCLKALNDLNP